MKTFHDIIPVANVQGTASRSVEEKKTTRVGRKRPLIIFVPDERESRLVPIEIVGIRCAKFPKIPLVVVLRGAFSLYRRRDKP